MKNLISISLLILLIVPIRALGQNRAKPLPDSPKRLVVTASLTNSPAADQSQDSQSSSSSPAGTNSQQPQSIPASATAEGLGFGGKFRYYASETYLNPAALVGPAFRAGIRMANPPGKGATLYPKEWRQGAEAFGRNYGDAVAERVSFNTARFVSGAIVHEDPRYLPSSSRNVFARSLHALSYTFVDRSDSGRCRPALSNFVGAAAGGFVGNAYLPSGFNDVTHAGQRSALQLGLVAGGNLFREFAPQMPVPLRTFFMLVGR